MNNLVLIFDFDGTIAPSITRNKHVLDKLFKDLGLNKLNNKQVTQLRDKRSQEAFKDFGISLLKVPFFVKKTRKFLLEILKNEKPVNDIKQTLHSLKNKGYRLGILTSNSKTAVEDFLKRNEMVFFEFIHSESTVFDKNKALKHLFKKRRVRPENAIYIGDETRDIEAAKRIGIRSIAVTWGMASEKILIEQKPDYLIRKPRELLDVVNDSLTKTNKDKDCLSLKN